MFIFGQFDNAIFTYVVLSMIVISFFVIFTLTIHYLERVVRRRLAERFGWSSVMWTGWLGTPIHELSHAAMCLLFRHRIDEIALFEPDSQSGRLGFVRHSWRKGNWFEEIGNLFIGIAPLMGGSLALLVLLRLFYPETFTVEASTQTAISDLPAFFQAVLAKLISPTSIFSFKFWVFVYLVLCVSSHMAPSKSDYQGASRGAWLLVLIWLGVISGLAVIIPDAESLSRSMLQILQPLFAILLVALLLCAAASATVFAITSIFPQRCELA